MYYKLYNIIDARNRGYKFNLDKVNKIEYFDEIKECTDNAFLFL